MTVFSYQITQAACAETKASLESKKINDVERKESAAKAQAAPQIWEAWLAMLLPDLVQIVKDYYITAALYIPATYQFEQLREEKEKVDEAHSSDFIAISPDGRSVMTYNPYGSCLPGVSFTIKKWKDKKLSRAATQPFRFCSIAINNTGSLVGGSVDRNMALVVSQEGKIRNVPSGYHGAAGDMCSVGIADDGTVIANTAGGTALVFKGNDDPIILKDKENKHRIAQVGVSQDAEILVTLAFDHTIKIWKKDGSCVHTLIGHDNFPECVAINGSGVIATGARNGVIKLWKNDACLETLKAHGDEVGSVAISDNAMVLSASSDGTVKVWKDGLCHITWPYPLIKLALSDKPQPRAAMACNGTIAILGNKLYTVDLFTPQAEQLKDFRLLPLEQLALVPELTQHFAVREKHSEEVGPVTSQQATYWVTVFRQMPQWLRNNLNTYCECDLEKKLMEIAMAQSQQKIEVSSQKTQ